jgi:hypothetical protein
MTNVHTKSVDGTIVPVSADWTAETRYASDRKVINSVHYERTAIQLRPSIDDQTFILSIPDGTTAHVDGENPVVPFIWRNGHAEKNINPAVIAQINERLETIGTLSMEARNEEKSVNSVSSRAQPIPSQMVIAVSSPRYGSPWVTWISAIVALAALIIIMAINFRKRLKL